MLACFSSSALRFMRPALSNHSECVCAKNRATKSCPAPSLSAIAAILARSFSTSAGGSTAM